MPDDMQIIQRHTLHELFCHPWFTKLSSLLFPPGHNSSFSSHFQILEKYGNVFRLMYFRRLNISGTTAYSPGCHCHCEHAKTSEYTTYCGGFLQGYKVYYTLTPDLPRDLWTVHVVEGSRLTTIPNLLTNRTYTVKVLAYTAVGDGPLSNPIQVKLQQGGILYRSLFNRCVNICIWC